jgi:hypothetical protein
VRVILIIAAYLLSCVPLLAEDLILRCDAKGQMSFSVAIDSTKHAVRSMGYATDVETFEFTETMIVAASKGAESAQSLVIDRVTGQFQLTMNTANSSESAANYQGRCAPARRLF